MALLDLLRRHSGSELRRLALLAGLAGLGNNLVMVVVNDAVSDIGQLGRDFLLFILAALVYAVAQWAVVRGSAREIEAIVHRLRLEILDRVRGTDIVTLGRLEPNAVFATVTGDTRMVTQAATVLMLSAQSVMLLVFTLLYLLWLSPLQCAVLLLAAAVLIPLQMRRRSGDRRAFVAVGEGDRRMLEQIADLLDGFKEAKSSPRRGAALLQAITSTTAATVEARADANLRISTASIVVQAGLYLIIAAMVFALPLLVEVEPDQRRSTITAVLFAVGSIGIVVQAAPMLAAADAAADSLVTLSRRLPKEAAGNAPLVAAAEDDGAPVVALRGVSYAWRNADGTVPFEVGPLDLDLRPGEIVFVTGGNGSGKSTLLRLAAGLLRPDVGTLEYRGEAIGDVNRQSYRDHIGAILGDLHLFRRIYGIVPDPARVATLIDEYGLTGKVRLTADGNWEGARALSGGQRKRLAMVALLLEDPRTIILDEWAADQDPAFRRRFYETILPGFRAEARVVLCATHDDHYFALADRCYRLVDGQLTLLSPSTQRKS